jgi:exodeoxyribonuclease VII small subunit
MAKSAAQKSPEDMPYEAAFMELQQIVTTVEAEPASLDQAISLFDRGKALVARCSKLLDEAELKVKRLAGSELVDFEEE